MKREGYFLAAIIVMVALSVFAVVKLPIKYGLDINGGERAVLQADIKGHEADYDPAVVQSIIEKRINSTGVAEPVVQQKGRDQFIVELPNVKNKDQVIDELQTTAQMEFHYFKDVKSPANQDARYTDNVGTDAAGREQHSFFDRQTGRAFRDQAQILTAFQAILNQANLGKGAVPFAIPAPLSDNAPTEGELKFTPDQITQITALNQELQDFNTLLADSPLILTGADVKPDAKATLGQTGSGPVVEFSFNPKGTDEFANFTRTHVNEILGIVLDGRVISDPKIDEPILDGSTEISGGFANLDEAAELASYLNAGALPVPLHLIQAQSVEATLGGSAVRHSIIAGCVGLALVLLFMGLYYLLPGLVADFALIIYALFTLAIFKGGLSWFIPAVTLTLPGIAGFILSVGMAVDANILIFERLKEELRNGKTLRLAIDSGFKRAFTAIRDSNICTIITCIILYSMGTPSVKGFALTLGIGVVVSLFTAITVTRTFLYLLVDAGADKHPEIFGLKRQWVTGIDASSVQQAGAQRINVIGKRKFFYLLSLAVIVPGIIFYFMGGLKKSIEFAGGTEVEVLLNSQSTTQTDIHKAIAGSFKDNLVQMGRDVLGPVAIIDIRDTDQHAYLRLDAALTKAGIGYRPLSHSLVSGVISKELTQNAFQAVIIASALIVLYLATAFAIGGFVAGLRFGLSAIAALLHDVLVLIGCFAILGYFLNWEIDSLFVTATLTVVGFSVHDTIVIFDRLRENLRHRLRGESFEDLANRSILQSFARSINTSFTVILTLLAMLFLGEPSTKLLVVALLIGIISGTYSSIFNATPILVDWEMYLGRRRVAFAGPQIASKPSTTSAPVQRLPENREPVGVASQSNDGAIQSGTTADGKSYKIKPKKKSGQRRF